MNVAGLKFLFFFFALVQAAQAIALPTELDSLPSQCGVAATQGIDDSADSQVAIDGSLIRHHHYLRSHSQRNRRRSHLNFVATLQKASSIRPCCARAQVNLKKFELNPSPSLVPVPLRL